MLDSSVVRRAVAAAQSILREGNPSMLIDGKAGTYTLEAYKRASASDRKAVDGVMSALGVNGSLPQANKEYKQSKSDAAATPSANGSKQAVFDLQIVPAVTREARRRKLNPINFITQLVLESGYGKSTPLKADGSPSYNYAGIKWNSVKTPEKAWANTAEFLDGKNVMIKDAFAAFTSADEFAVAYFNYLFNGPSSYRYKGRLEVAKTPFEFGAVLQQGGYATDPKYAEKFAGIAASVAKRYSLA